MSIRHGISSSFDISTVSFSPIVYYYGTLGYYSNLRRGCIRRYSCSYNKSSDTYSYLATYRGIRNNISYIESNVADVSDVNSRRVLDPLGFAHGENLYLSAPTEFSLDTLFKLAITSPNNGTHYFIDVAFFQYGPLFHGGPTVQRNEKQLRIFRYGILEGDNVTAMRVSSLHRRGTT